MLKKVLLGTFALVIVLGAVLFVLAKRPLKVDANVIFKGPPQLIGLALKGDEVVEVRGDGLVKLQSSLPGATSIKAFTKGSGGEWQEIGSCLYLEKPFHKNAEVEIIFTGNPGQPLNCKTLNFSL